jgi:hypothetical protein
MTSASLIVVADRGNVKAYQVNETPTRGPSLQLVQAIELTDAHGRYNEKLTDQAGRFPVGDGGGAAGSGRHMNGIAERQALEDENDRRLFHQVAGHVADVVRTHAPERWSFAAPSEINPEITALFPAEAQKSLVENVKADLVHIEPKKLVSHFESIHTA